MGSIEEFASARGMKVRAVGDRALSISVDAHPDLLVEVTVAEAVHEWFIDVRDASTGERLFRDWCDHQGYDHATREELQQELYETVTAYLSAVQGATLRVRRSPGRFNPPQLEVMTDDSWRNVWDLT